MPQGYPEDIDRVIGHLQEACRHVTKQYPDLASLLRQYRLRVMDDSTYYPPYNDILSYITVLTACEDGELPVPELPESLKVTIPSGG